MQQQEENVVAGLYDNYAETQREVLAIELRKTRNKLLMVAAVILVFDLIAFAVSNMVTLQTLIWIILVPGIIAGLGFLAMKEPVAAAIIATVIVVGLWIYAIAVTGGRAAVSGWLGKAIIIYLLIAGFQSAREASSIKKELKELAA